MMAVTGFNLKHWQNKVILIFILICTKLIAEVFNILTENRNGLVLMPVWVECEKMRGLAGLTD
jgi:hypothetical protein